MPASSAAELAYATPRSLTPPGCSWSICLWSPAFSIVLKLGLLFPTRTYTCSTHLSPGPAGCLDPP
eukprot:4163089-Prorocentrum_lima.AAC.1